jgi:hypothetical protein
MNGNCPVCKRLSANLSEATKSYLAILTTIQLAHNENNPALVSELQTIKRETQEKRGIARQELRWHEATHPKAKGQTA